MLPPFKILLLWLCLVVCTLPTHAQDIRVLLLAPHGKIAEKAMIEVARHISQSRRSRPAMSSRSNNIRCPTCPSGAPSRWLRFWPLTVHSLSRSQRESLARPRGSQTSWRTGACRTLALLFSW